MVSHFPVARSASVGELNLLDLIVARFRDVPCFAIRCHYQKGDNWVSSYLLLAPKFPDSFEEPLLKDYLDGHIELSKIQAALEHEYRIYGVSARRLSSGLASTPLDS